MENNLYVIDSSVFVAFYRESDTLHAEALRTMKDISEAQLAVHPYVIQEAATVLTYRVSTALGRRFVNDIRGASNVVIPTVDIESDMKRFSDTRSKVSFTDVALVAFAKDRQARLVTFDKQMMALAKRIT